MTAKEIMRLSPEARLALEVRARVGDGESVRDYLLSAAWRQIFANKGATAKEKVRAFMQLFKGVNIVVEPA